MQPCTHDIVFIVYAWMCICMNAWMTTRLVWLYGGLTCMIVWMIDLVEQDWTGKIESDPTSHHKHSAIFNGDDATRVYQNSDGVKPGVCSNWWGINISWGERTNPKNMVGELVLLWSCLLLLFFILFIFFFFFFWKKQLTTCNLQGLSILRVAVDTPFIYSRVQRKSVLSFFLLFFLAFLKVYLTHNSISQHFYIHF